MYRYPTFEKAMNEYIDYSDDNTRKIFLSLDEDGQTEALSAITSKLYDKIVDKVDDIDFGDIPLTKGDIEKLPNYDKLVDCLDIMRELLIQYKQPTEPVDIVNAALENIRTRRNTFMKVFTYKLEFPMVVYNTISLSIVASISVLIAACVEFIKTPGDESFQMSLDKTGLYKSKDYILFTDLKKFNNTCRNGELDKALDYMINNHVKKFTGVEIGLFAGSIAMIAIIFNIIPIMRELIYFFYHTRVRVADYFEMQANLLQMNAYNVQSNSSLDKEEREQISKKQLKVVELFKKISNFVSVKVKTADVNATKEIVSDNKKYKADEVMDSLPDSAAGSLF